MEEDIKYELEDLRSIADGAVPPELSKNEAINIINFIENLINRNKTLEKEIKLMKSVNLEDNYIPKSKVREKIEQLEIRIDYLKTELNKIYVEIEKGTETDIDNLSTLEYYYEKELDYRERQKDILQELLQERN